MRSAEQTRRLSGQSPQPWSAWPQGPSDLPLDEAEHQQGQADDLDQGGDPSVVLDEDRRDGQGAFDVVVPAFDRALPPVVDQDLGRACLLGGQGGQQRVPAVDGGLRFQNFLVEVPGQGGDATVVLGDGGAQGPGAWQGSHRYGR
ncbi:hypothetical protein [Streptomyces californicus]|uniref:hypothetical protein n=1 Tax=Streptomyces californicus TaxID=67351 RepID=UPI0037936060